TNHYNNKTLDNLTTTSSYQDFEIKSVLQVIFFFCYCSGYFICVIALLINKVYPQVTVEAVIGSSVVLPCSSAKRDQDTEVHWRHNNSKIVYDIIKGEYSVALQDQQYKNRVETFPDEYERGNFSIKLNNLQHADAGEFSCFIKPSDKQETIKLIPTESTTEKENKNTEQENQGPETKSDWWKILLICVCTLVLVFLFIIAYFMVHRGKKSSSSVIEGTVFF
ncbi:ICOS ligand-like, partial [Labeo rohita]|uniref:ICOS ligand-like n=1 Tax=Labeo rohita TaxID=84645 RepID=UPI0021E2ABAF